MSERIMRLGEMKAEIGVLQCVAEDMLRSKDRITLNAVSDVVKRLTDLARCKPRHFSGSG